MTNSQRYQHLVAQAEKPQTVVDGVVFYDVMVNQLFLGKIVAFLRSKDKEYTVIDGIKVYLISRAGFRLGELGSHIKSPEQILGEKDRIKEKGEYMVVGWFQYGGKGYLILNQLQDESLRVHFRDTANKTVGVIGDIRNSTEDILKNPPQ